jgi:hypothetical protein
MRKVWGGGEGAWTSRRWRSVESQRRRSWLATYLYDERGDRL